MLVEELRKSGLVNEATGRLDPDAFAKYISQPKAAKPSMFDVESRPGPAADPGRGAASEEPDEAFDLSRLFDTGSLTSAGEEEGHESAGE
ncbi:MAG TPA: hypothetical protein VF668_04695 [Pyrinomonadaceae bacterium]